MADKKKKQKTEVETPVEENEKHNPKEMEDWDNE